MATDLIQTINRIKDSLNEAALRGMYDRACIDFAGDAAAMFAIREATVARKERFEYLSKMRRANARQARSERCEDDTPSLENCDDWGTGEGQYHGRI